MDKAVELTTNRLSLRPLNLYDIDDIYEYTNDPEWARYQVNIPSVPFSRNTVEELVTMFSNPPDSQGILQMFAIVYDGKVIGEICLNQHDEYLCSDRCEIIYALSRIFWGKGLMTEAVKAVMNWAFSTHQNLHRMYACCNPKNIGSQRVLEKLGLSGRVNYGITRNETTNFVTSNFSGYCVTNGMRINNRPFVEL